MHKIGHTAANHPGSSEEKRAAEEDKWKTTRIDKEKEKNRHVCSLLLVIKGKLSKTVTQNEPRQARTKNVFGDQKESGRRKKIDGREGNKENRREVMQAL